MTLEQLKSSYDWAYVFADDDDGNVTKDTESCDGCDATPPSRDDVAEIIASVYGENDGPNWEGIFRLKDGRYLFASGGCDHTGWG